MVKIIKDWKLILLMCLTIGLAPYFPEPHIFGKIKWIAGGAKGMQFMDWFDVLLHGFPWVLAIIYLASLVVKNRKNLEA